MLKRYLRIDEYHKHNKRISYRNLWQRCHLDLTLLSSILILISFGLVILYSATNENNAILSAQVTRFFVALAFMLAFSQISPHSYQRWALGLYIAGILMLLAVLLGGHIGKGAQRWLDFGLFRFQPSELLKLALPMMLARYLSTQSLPPDFKTFFVTCLIIVVPVVLTMRQPDLGTAVLIASSGFCVLLLAAISWRVMGLITFITLISAPIFWFFMHSYQRERILTFLNPERDPLGSGYHIIQSKIAIGSGGIFGKGWLHGTQAHLAFLPEHATDFIFAVCGEEFGLLGGMLFICLYLFITVRCLYISSAAQDTFSRLLAGTLSFMFFISAFVNIGMVSGILPVVGLPLPLISYGGSAIVTTLASFGILMSIHTHRRLIAS